MSAALVTTVVLDCNAPAALAEFWGTLLDLPVADKSEDWWQLEPMPGGLSLAFQKVGNHRPPSPSRPQQLHLDVRVDDLDRVEQVVLANGGRVLSERHEGDNGPWRVYTDPAGHPFCLVSS